MDRLVTKSGINIDLEKGVPIPLTLSIADFKQPEKRQRNFSKEITLPGTAQNMAFFSSAFNLTRVGSSYDFNGSAKVECTYFKNNTPILNNAVLKLNKAIILDGEVEFKVGLFSDFVDIFLILSNISVRDLDWSDYGHTLNNANIINSWSGTPGTGYYYPLIERQERASLSSWRNTEMVPYVHFVDVFDRCMKIVGQNYESKWLLDSRVKNILFGFGGGTYVDAAISPAEQNNRAALTTDGYLSSDFSTQAESSPVSVEGPAYFPGIPFEGNIVLTEDQDIYNQLDGISFTAAKSGAMRLKIAGQIRMRYQGPEVVWASGGNRLLYYTCNGVQFPLLNLEQTAADQVFTLSISQDLDVQQGDFIQLHLGSTYVNFTYPQEGDTSIDFDLVTTALLDIDFTSTQNAITEGSSVEVRRFMPDMKCSEFILGAIRLANLMISDPDIYGTVSIEPMRDFYQGTDKFTDISEEVDHDKEIEIRPSANEYAKRLSFKFKEATETDFKKYEDKWGTPYGDLEFDQASFFAKGEQKIELPFATILPYQIYDLVIVPRFTDIDESGEVKPTKGAPRIMFRNGLKTGSWQLVGDSATDNLTTYPSVHHFNDWEDPTLDLNFQLVSELYHLAFYVTTNNSYREYYRRFIEEIVSTDGKYVQLYRKMTDSQIKNLDWSKLLMWNGSLFRFNKVVDFDSEITEVTKIEMIKVLKAKKGATGGTVSAVNFLGSASVSSPEGGGLGTDVISAADSNTLQYSKIIQG